MNNFIAPGVGESYAATGPSVTEDSQSAVSWGAIFSGAAANLGLTLVLVTLVSGLGLSMISPWTYSGVKAETFAITTGIALIVVQWLAAAAGGFLAGRLRTKWAGLHNDEVFFRDTAHGFLSWAIAAIISGVLLVSTLSSIAGGTAQVAAQAAGPVLNAVASGVSAYDVDMLFRGERPDTADGRNAMTAEATSILAAGLVKGDVPAADRDYLAKMVAARSGVQPAEARQRIDALVTAEQAAMVKAKQAADTARKAASRSAILTALAMLLSAFAASVAGAYGGNYRDEY